MRKKRQVGAQGAVFQRQIRRLEWITVTVGLFILSGALFPLLMQEGDGVLDAAARSRLRLLFLPIYVFSLLLLSLQLRRVFAALMSNLPLIMLLLLSLVSVLWSINPSVSLRRSVALLMSMALALLLATRFTPRQQIVAVGSVLGVSVMLSVLAGVAMPGLAYMPDSSALRGIFFNKNVLGWMSVILIVAGLAAREDGLQQMRRLGTILLVLGWLGCLLSTSVTSLLAGITAIGISRAALVVARQRGMARFVSIMCILLGSLLISIAIAKGFVPLMEALGKDATLTGRVPLWGLIDPEIARSLTFGYGYGAYWSETNTAVWQIWERLEWGAPHAHNGFRDLMLGVGLVGLGLFLIVTVRGFFQSIALMAAAPHVGWVWCVTLIGCTLVMNVTESTILMQNDLLWVLFSTAVFSVSLHHRALQSPVPRFVRLMVSAT